MLSWGVPCPKGCQAIVLSPVSCVPKSCLSISGVLCTKGCEATVLSLGYHVPKCC